MFIYIAIIISIIGLLIATYTDIKERIVPNKLNYSLALLGLIVFGTYSITSQNPTFLLYSFIGMCWGFFFGWILWKIGIFAGGDVKLFMGLGALNPLTPALLKFSIFNTGPLFSFPIMLFVYSLIAFFPYGMIFVLYKLTQNKKFRKHVLADMKQKTIQGIHASFFIAGTYVILSKVIPIDFLWSLIIVEFIIIFAWGQLGNRKIFVTIIAFVGGAYLDLIIVTQSFIGLVIMIVFIYGIIKLMFALRPLLSSKININKIEEGMIPGNSLAWKGKKVVKVQPLSISRIIKYVKEQQLNKIFEKNDLIVSSTKARGFNEEEMKELKRLAKKGLIPKEISIKESMPFVPTMLIGYLLAVIFGDFLWFLFMGI
jgi:archaeal preflagellin peptidase FlaK